MRALRAIAALFLLAAGVRAAGAEGAGGAAAATAGAARGKEAAEEYELAAEVRKAAEPFFAKGKHVGLVVGAYAGGRRAVVAFGRKDADRDEAPDGRTVYEIGSVTKVFTAAILETMVEAGSVRLGQQADELLPADMKLPAWQDRKITLQHLVTHTSGLPRLPDDLLDLRRANNPYAWYTQKDMGAFLARTKLKVAPGEKYEYSNMGVGLLGLALAQKSGTDYEALVTSAVCKPLGMNDTAITLSADGRRRLAQGYSRVAPIRMFQSSLKSENWAFQECFAGAGALVSTADDMLKFIAANLGQGDAGLVAALAKTHRPLFKVDDGLSVGMAWHIARRDKEPRELVWHNGGTGGYASFIAFSKAERAGVVVLANTAVGVEDAGIAVLMTITGHNAARPATDVKGK